MARSASKCYHTLAEAFAYPSAERLDALQAGAGNLPEGSVLEGYRAFLQQVRGLSLAEWEELYTRTLDLNPLVAPYVGYHLWGDGYRRGPFLSKMNRALDDAGVDKMGELPDHIAPVLRYLAVTPEPLSELMEALGPALDSMISTLRKAESKNAYVDLFRAVQACFLADVRDAERRDKEAR